MILERQNITQQFGELCIATRDLAEGRRSLGRIDPYIPLRDDPQRFLWAPNDLTIIGRRLEAEYTSFSARTALVMGCFANPHLYDHDIIISACLGNIIWAGDGVLIMKCDDELLSRLARELVQMSYDAIDSVISENSDLVRLIDLELSRRAAKASGGVAGELMPQDTFKGMLYDLKAAIDEKVVTLANSKRPRSSAE